MQARLQATRDAASCCKQFAIPLAQRITLWCPPLPSNFLKRELPQLSSLRDASFNRLFAHDVIAVGLRLLLTQVYKPLFPAFSVNFLTFPLMNNTFSYMMKAPCVFSVWSIYAFINSAKHRHLEFLLLISMEKKSLPALQLLFERHQNHVFANNLYSAQVLLMLTGKAKSTQITHSQEMSM